MTKNQMEVWGIVRFVNKLKILYDRINEISSFKKTYFRK